MSFSRDVKNLNPHIFKRKKKVSLRVRQKKVKTEPVDYVGKLFDQCVQSGLPTPLREVAFARELGLGFQCDLGWSEPKRVIAEINGGIWGKGGHSTGRGLTRDFFKQSVAQLLDFEYYEFSPQMVENGFALHALLCVFGKIDTFGQDWRELWQTNQIRTKKK